MSVLKRLFLDKVTFNGNDVELDKSEFYARASRVYFNKEELRQVLKELHHEGDIALKQQAQKVFFQPPAYKKGERGQLIRW